jgi:hypothetical protein
MSAVRFDHRTAENAWHGLLPGGAGILLATGRFDQPGLHTDRPGMIPTGQREGNSAISSAISAGPLFIPPAFVPAPSQESTYYRPGPEPLAARGKHWLFPR